MDKNDFIFKINYKSEKYQTIFNNINKIFNGNYLNFISQIKLTHPYLVELFIFLRKYQYFVHYIKIDKQILCLFDDKEKPIFERILNIKQMMNNEKDNICSIKFELLPKFTKKEINFEIPNDVLLLEININLRLKNEDNKINIEINKGANIQIKNLDGIIDKNILNGINKILNQIFDLHIEEANEKNFKILNKCINYIENYLPIILPDNLKVKENRNVESDKNIVEDYWTQGEQNKFEELLIKYKSIKDLKAKMKKVSEEFQTKTLKQIISRYKSIALKATKKNEEIGNKIYDKLNIDNNMIDQNNTKQNPKINTELLKEEIKTINKNEELINKNIIDKKQKEKSDKKKQNNIKKNKNKKEDEKKIEKKENEENEEKNKEEEKEKNKKKEKENNIEKKQNEKNEIEEIKEDWPKKEKNKEEEKEEESSIEKAEKNDEVDDLPSLDLNSKQISLKSISSQSSYTDNSKLYNSLENTEDIINAIINVYNKNYKYHDLSLLQENSKDKNFSFYLNSIEDDDELEENEEEQNDEEEISKNNDNEKIKNKNEELLDLYLSSSFQPLISNEDLTLIKNILNFGDKYQVNLKGVQLNNISIIQISHIKLLLKCSKCKKVAFESKYIKLNKLKNIFYLGTTCPRCQNEIFSIFISDFIHQNNLTNAGVCYITGGNVIEYLPSMYNLECEKCGQNKTIKLRTGCLHLNDSNCRKCNAKLNFVILSSTVNNIFISDLKDLADIKITNFEKFTFAIKDDINLDIYVKKFDKAIQEGKELPDFGACKHYKYSLRWFRFGCCNKIFPCDICHDETSDHNCEYAKTILCGFCSFEQTANNKVCSKCGKMFTKSEGGKKFWEGGKGCRNPLFMGTRDSHKYTGLNKTISRKKRREIQNNQKK